MEDAMTTNLTQAIVGRLHEDHPQGAILFDATVPGLRVVFGKKASSFKLIGKINNPGGCELLPENRTVTEAAI